MSHLDDTLAQLEDFIKSDVFRKSVGIFSLFKVRWVVVVAEVGAWEDYPRLTVAAACMWSPPMGLDSVCMGVGGCLIASVPLQWGFSRLLSMVQATLVTRGGCSSLKEPLTEATTQPCPWVSVSVTLERTWYLFSSLGICSPLSFPPTPVPT